MTDSQVFAATFYFSMYKLSLSTPVIHDISQAPSFTVISCKVVTGCMSYLYPTDVHPNQPHHLVVLLLQYQVMQNILRKFLHRAFSD